MKKDKEIHLSYEERELLREILQSQLLAIKRAATYVSENNKEELRRRETIITGLFRLTDEK